MARSRSTAGPSPTGASSSRATSSSLSALGSPRGTRGQLEVGAGIGRARGPRRRGTGAARGPAPAPGPPRPAPAPARGAPRRSRRGPSSVTSSSGRPWLAQPADVGAEVAAVGGDGAGAPGPARRTATAAGPRPRAAGRRPRSTIGSAAHHRAPGGEGEPDDRLGVGDATVVDHLERVVERDALDGHGVLLVALPIVGTSSRPRARNSAIVSSDMPGRVVERGQVLHRGSAARPASSASSRVGGEPLGARRRRRGCPPAARAARRSSAARYWRTRVTVPSSCSGTTATAPGWWTIVALELARRRASREP